jgi:hypothetical protein
LFNHCTAAAAADQVTLEIKQLMQLIDSFKLFLHWQSFWPKMFMILCCDSAPLLALATLSDAAQLVSFTQ